MDMITVYGTQNCNPCKKVKAYLEKGNKEYEFLDVGLDENAEKLKSYGFNSVPLVVSGETVIHGFQPDELDKL